MKKTKEPSFKCVQDVPTVLDERTSVLIQHVDMISSITTDSLYLLNIPKKQFSYVKSDDLFLCGFSVEDALRLGYDFYPKIIYPEDLSLWTDMRKAVLQYLENFDKKQDRICFFSCTFRLQRKYSFLSRSLPQMIYHRMKPVWIVNELRYLICYVEGSTIKDSGNLRVYYKGVSTPDEYDFITKCWKQKKDDLLTEHERAILMLAQQGKSTIGISDYLCKGCNTVRNQIKRIFEKLNVHSITEAINIASTHHLIYVSEHITSELEHTSVEVSRKRTRVLITDDMMQHIQGYLDDGLSLRKTADKLGISESAIRYWKKKEKLKQLT